MKTERAGNETEDLQGDEEVRVNSEALKRRICDLLERADFPPGDEQLNLLDATAEMCATGPRMQTAATLMELSEAFDDSEVLLEACVNQLLALTEVHCQIYLDRVDPLVGKVKTIADIPRSLWDKIKTSREWLALRSTDESRADSDSADTDGAEGGPGS